MIDRRYSTKTITAMREVCIRWLDGHRDLYDEGLLEWTGDAVAVDEVEDWCRVWIENDPFDNGGDASVRRGMRPEWPRTRDMFWRMYGQERGRG